MVIPDGLEDDDNIRISTLLAYKGYLYLGTERSSWVTLKIRMRKCGVAMTA